MQKIIYGLQGSGKTSVGKKISELEKLNFIDLDEYIVQNKLDNKSVSEFIKSFEDQKEGWDKFRFFEFESLREVLEKGYSVISVGGGTLSFDINTDTLLCFDVIKIFLEIDVKTQVERLLNNSATGNQNRYTQTDATTREQELTNLYNARIGKYRSIADGIVDVNTSSIDEVVSMVNDKILFLEEIVPLRNQIDTIDDELISILQTGNLLNIDIPEININFKTEKATNDTYNFIENNYGFIESSNRIIELLKYRFTIVQQIGELKRKYNETLVQGNRKEQVRNKWLSGGEKLGEIYDFIHEKALEIE